MKFFVLLILFLGEFIAIALEILLASKFKDSAPLPEVFRWLVYLTPLFILCSVFLLVGYIYGYRYFQKIWIVSIVSWSSIILVEPALNYIIFKELPSGKVLMGGILALAAIIISIF